MRDNCNISKFVVLKAFHIHIKGIVQGVGFRPFVYKYAKKQQIKGWVNNTNDGVHIHINTNRKKATIFLKNLLDNLPPLAVVTQTNLEEVVYKKYSDFKIIHSKNELQPNLLLTPDAAICEDCKEELHDKNNRRYQYSFITCTNCGPRYSIIVKLAYDRPNTTMESFKMCETCQTEYNNPLERRHYSQTNSCLDCRVEMQIFENEKLQENFTDLDYIVKNWEAGRIIAIKGIGGYLLTCDATNAVAIKTLRKRKQRPTKPFALLYPTIECVQKDVLVSDKEYQELMSIHAPIVLLEIKEEMYHNIAINEISHGLSRLGIMLPYTPLYELLLSKFKKPVIATSANITGSTIIYTDKKAIEELSTIADIIVLNNREILLPQDDSVVQFTREHQQKITLRRSRGKAPNYINLKQKTPKETVFATGAMLKSVFGLQHNQNTYISQYMGNTASYDAQLNYEKTYTHFETVFKFDINTIIVDKHPDYFATYFGKALAQKHQADYHTLQHHKAHFYSVLGERNLLKTSEKVLGVVWDGTGLGDDGNIWGGEFFSYKEREIKRIFHIDEFDFILGDKMPKEPRISALAITHKINGSDKYVKQKFTEIEWNIYKKLLRKKDNLKSSSMGRVFDAVSSVLFHFDVHNYEAEASMQLEKQAAQYYYQNKFSLQDSYLNIEGFPINFVEFLFLNIFNDLDKEIDKQLIAVKFHLALVAYIIKVADKFNFTKLAFSGGVFQNALLVDMLIEFMGEKFELFFQEEFSPNDEGISFGQLMYYNNR